MKCNCRFYCHYNIACNHIMSVLNYHQVRSIANIHPSNERWTKRYQWENYSEVDKNLKPMDAQLQRQLREIDHAETDVIYEVDEDEAVAQKKMFDDHGPLEENESNRKVNEMQQKSDHYRK